MYERLRAECGRKEAKKAEQNGQVETIAKNLWSSKARNRGRSVERRQSCEGGATFAETPKIF